MITAKNYAAQVSQSLKYAAVSLLKNNEITDGTYSGHYAGMIDKAIHFALPDTARLLDDGLKGLVDNLSKLPYPIITVEYFAHDLSVTADDPIHNFYKSGVDKICILAVEHPSPMYSEKGFSLHTFGCDYGGWATMPVGLFVPENAATKMSSLDDFKIIGTLPDSCQKLYAAMTADRKKEVIEGMLKISALPVFELLEALTCRNVSAVNHQDASPANAKRIKAGKLPFYETKMLVIDTRSSTSGKSGDGGGSHASPRQHLRRGHIRRLESGNIWVNSCVVGDPTKGSINKQYSVA
jgi:hypothetical protein